MARDALEALKDHWALAAVGRDSLEHAESLLIERLAEQAVGNLIDFSFSVDSEDD